MAKVLITESILQDTADAIREKGGTVATMKPSEFATNIEDIEIGADLSDYFGNEIPGGGSASSGLNKIIKRIPQGLTISTISGMSYSFKNCSSLIEIPQLDTSAIQYMRETFSGCSSLTTVPVLDTTSVIAMESCFNGCSSLNNSSLNNIMQMCINTTSAYTGTKTLRHIGLSSTQATTCQSLSNYQAFLNAGWTTGY